MATVQIRTSLRSLNLESGDEAAAELLYQLQQAFAETGGMWLTGAVDEAHTVIWVSAADAVAVTFDGPIPERVRHLAAQAFAGSEVDDDVNSG